MRVSFATAGIRPQAVVPALAGAGEARDRYVAWADFATVLAPDLRVTCVDDPKAWIRHTEMSPVTEVLNLAGDARSGALPQLQERVTAAMLAL